MPLFNIIKSLIKETEIPIIPKQMFEDQKIVNFYLPFNNKTMKDL